MMANNDDKARAAFMAAFEPAGGWADQADLDRAFRAVTPTQRTVIAMLAEDPAGVLIRLPGGFWTTASCHVNAMGTPDWSVPVQTVRAMEAKGLLVRRHVLPDGWRDHRGLPKAVA